MIQAVKIVKNNKEGGFTLLETIVAVGVVLVGLTSALALISSSLYYISNIRDRLITANLAAEGIEVIRNIRDNNWLQNQEWNNGLSDGDYQVSYNSQTPSLFGADMLLYDSATGFYNYTFGVATPYVRKITIENGPKTDLFKDEMRVVSTVTWQKRGINYSNSVEEHLFDWR